jgi:hypothetical protein
MTFKKATGRVVQIFAVKFLAFARQVTPRHHTTSSTPQLFTATSLCVVQTLYGVVQIILDCTARAARV